MDQLDLRRFEIYQTYKALKELVVNGGYDGLEPMNGNVVDWNFLRGKVNLDRIQICGHSFGGSTVVSCELCHCL
jgi:platelet-activating factor acetylhydrolase